MGSAAHIRVAVLADVLVVFVFGVVFAIFGIRSRSYSRLLAVDGEVVGTHGVWWCVQPVSFLDMRWCERMVGDGEGHEERGNV